MNNENELYKEHNTIPVDETTEKLLRDKEDKCSKQSCLFGEKYNQSIQEKEWKDMPEFVQNNVGPYRTIHVHFKTQEDLEKFAKLVDQTITPLTKSLWYPYPDIFSYMDKRYIDLEKYNEEEDES